MSNYLRPFEAGKNKLKIDKSEADSSATQSVATILQASLDIY